ncbi:MAG: DNA-protecting protein DprA [Actinobacteria bacterium]|nr:MAG: DNA-protecting protein DprA [Actinomycetota bacterium]
MTSLNPHWYAAWWSAIVEPGDPHAAALRHALGDEAAHAWATAASPGPLPTILTGEDGQRKKSWDEAWARWKPRIDTARPEEDLALLDSMGGHLLTPSSSQWPESLSDLGAEEPIALWVLGSIPIQHSVAIVGARASSHYGNRYGMDIAAELTGHGWNIVSGGAFGIDAAAHRGALAGMSEGSGATTAVMAGGVGKLYPAAHEELFAQIIDLGGAVLSEVPPNWRPARWRFLGRNRVIAALSRATIVIEAGRRSGALATARRALDLGRHVGALPGPVGVESSSGCHELIRNGATLIRHAQDIIEMLTPLNATLNDKLFGEPAVSDTGVDALPPDQRRVWEALPKRSGTSLPRLARASGMSERDTLVALAGLELSGMVRAHAAGWARA